MTREQTGPLPKRSQRHLLLLSLLVSATLLVVQGDVIQSAEGAWGGWSGWTWCSGNSFFNGAVARSEGSQGDGDDTAMNAVRFQCDNTAILISSEGGWGGWGSWTYCPSGSFINGFQTRVEAPISGDDTALNQVLLYCRSQTGTFVDQRSSSSSLATLGGTTWGAWGSAVFCPNGQAVKGFQVRIEGSQGSGDDTAFNTLRLDCQEVCGTSCGAQGWCNYVTKTCQCRQYYSGASCNIAEPPSITPGSVSISPQFIVEETTSITCLYTYVGKLVLTDQSIIEWYFNNTLTFTGPATLSGPFPPRTRIYCRVKAKGTSGSLTLQSDLWETSSTLMAGGIYEVKPEFSSGFVLAYERTSTRQNLLWRGVSVSQAVAASRCREINGFLVTISSAETNNDIMTLLSSSSFSEAWIGLSWNGTAWVFPTGETPTNYLPIILPSNPTLRCVKISSAGAWTIVDCSVSLPFVCHRPIISRPTSLETLVVSSQPYNLADATSRCRNRYNGYLSTTLARSFDLQRIRTSTDLFANTQCSLFWVGLRYSASWAWPFFTLWDPVFTTVPTAPQNGDGTAITTTTVNSVSSSLTACFACDSTVITLTPQVSSLSVSKFGVENHRIEIAERGPSSFVSIQSTLITGDFSITNLKPGVTYWARLLRGNFTTLPWEQASALKTHCDCELNVVRNGAPTNFEVVQQKGQNIFRYRDNSACDTMTTVKYWDGSVEYTVPYLHFEAQVCPSSTVTAYPTVLFNSLQNIPVGRTLRYCITVSNADKFYQTTPVCLSKSVDYIGTINGEVKTKVGDPVRGVTVFWSAEGTTLSGSVVVDDFGKFVIEIQTPLITSSSQQIRLRPVKRTGNLTHQYEFATSCPRGSCFSDNQNTTGLVLVDHLISNNIVLNDLTVFSVTGLVQYQGTNCPVENARVCVTAYGQRTCTTSNRMGQYVLTTPIFADAVIEASFSIGDRFLQLTQTTSSCPLGSKTLNSNATISYCTVRMNNNIEVNFLVTSLVPTVISFYGGNPECRLSIGTATFIYTPIKSCTFTQSITVSNSARAPISLPPMDYLVRMDIVSSPAIKTYFDAVGNTIQFLNLTTNLQAENVYEYHVPATIDVLSVGPDARCTGNFVVQGAPKGLPIRIRARVYEDYSTAGQCYFAGNLTFSDGLIDEAVAKQFSEYTQCFQKNGGCSVPAVIENSNYRESYVNVQTLPGTPNIASPFTKEIRFRLRSSPHPDVIKVEQIIVTGRSSTGNSFSTELAVAMPSTIVYRPPGDLSKAWISKGTTFNSEFSIGTESSNGGGGSLSVIGGVSESLTACVGLGVSVCKEVFSTSISAGVTTSTTFTSSSSSSTTLSASTTIETSIETSEDPGLPSGYGDVVVVSALSFKKSESIEISYNRSVCRASSRIILSWSPSVSGTSIRTIHDIRNYDIPDIEGSIELEEANEGLVQADEREAYDLRLTSLRQGLENWYNILDYHNRTRQPGHPSIIPMNQYNRAACINQKGEDYCDQPSPNFNFSSDSNGRIFFTGGGQIYSMTTTFENSYLKSSDSTSALSTEVEGIFSTEFEAVVTWSIEAKAFGVFDSSKTTSNSKGSSLATTVGFQLGDSNVGDKFAVELLVNKDFGTPFFRLLSGISSCPNELGTLQRDKVSITADFTAVTNIPPDQQAVFTLVLQSLSETREERTYLLTVNENKNGAKLFLSGSPFTTKREVSLNWGVKHTFTLTVERGPIAYTYDDITISAVSACESEMEDNLYREPIGDSVSLTVEFLQPCAPFEWASTWSYDIPEYFRVNTLSKNEPIFGEYIQVAVQNPHYPNLPWSGNNRLQKVYVEYKHESQNVWLPAVTDHANNPAIITEKKYGLGDVLVDTSTWPLDGIYLLRVRSLCQAVVGAGPVYNGYVSPQPRPGRVDRNPPHLLGNYAQPKSGVWLPGDEISIAFNEKINCALLSYPFEGVITIFFDTYKKSYSTIDHEPYFNYYCQDNKIYFQFGQRLPYSIIKGKNVKLFVAGVQDLAGNTYSDTVTWSFTVQDNITAQYLSLTYRTRDSSERLLEYVRSTEGSQKRSLADVDIDDELCPVLTNTTFGFPVKCLINGVGTVKDGSNNNNNNKGSEELEVTITIPMTGDVARVWATETNMENLIHNNLKTSQFVLHRLSHFQK